MMKQNKIVPVIFTMLLVLQLVTPLFTYEVNAEDTSVGTDYYISSLNGDNSKDGKSTSAAWETLDKLKNIELSPGDHVYLESGSVFNGYIHLREVNGTAENPIIITNYGEGNKPVINGNGEGVWYQDYNAPMDNAGHVNKGYVSSTILFYDSNYIEMSNLEITNESDDWDYMYTQKEQGKDRMSRTGVAGISQNTGTMTHIYLDSLDIHDVDGNVELKHMNNGGIQFNVSKPENESETGIARYHDIKFTNNTISRINRSGISFGYTYQHKHFEGGQISDEVIAKYGHTDIVFEGNYVLEAGNDAIVVMYADRPVISGNVAEKPGFVLKDWYPDYWMSFSAGIWPWKTKDALFEYNEVFDTNGEGNGDGQAWDVDYSDGTVYQYNYSHNNGGGAILFCLGESVNGEFRYNISHNDLQQLITLQGNPLAKIYNNLFYVDGDRSTRVHHSAEGKRGGQAYIANNIFYNTSSENPNDQWENNDNQIFTNNLYYGYDSAPTGDEHAVIVDTDTDSMFVNVNDAPTSAKHSAHERSAFNGFKITEDFYSLVANKGIYVSNTAVKDFFDNPIGLIPDIGIEEVDANEDVKEIFVESYEMSESKIYEIPKATTVGQFKGNIRRTSDTEVSVRDSNDDALADDVKIKSGQILQVIFNDGSTLQYELELSTEYVAKSASAGSYQNGEGPELVLDGNNETIWHTEWDGTTQDKVWISLDLGEVNPISILKYVPRQSGNNGLFTKYSIFIKENENDEWKKVDTESNTWSVDNTIKYANFETTNARYIKLQADESATQETGKIFGSAAEIRVGHEEGAE